MQIHKPKLARDWHKFAMDMGSIICGILIALGLEQTVEWQHRRGEVAEARKALRSEIADNAGAAHAVVEQERCMAALEERLIAESTRARLPTIHRAAEERAVDLVVPTMGIWDVVKGGAGARMPFEERVAYSRFYDSVALSQSNADAEGQLWRRIIGYAETDTRTPESTQRAVEDAAELKFIGRLRVRASLAQLDGAKAMRIKPAPPTATQRADVALSCKTAGMTPRL